MMRFIASLMCTPLALFLISGCAASAKDAGDVFGCWLAAEQDGAATYKLEACGPRVCGRAIKAAIGGHRPTTADLTSDANKNLFVGEKMPESSSWTGKIYIFRLSMKVDVTVELLSKNELQIGNMIAHRNWKRISCPS